ncbi:MAG: SpoIIE family protein phosphatase [Desulfovermiculus sp.]
MPLSTSHCISNVESTLHAILETAVDGIVVVDTKGIIQAANKAVSTIFGYSREQIYKHPVSVLMPEPYCSNHQSFIERYLHSKKGRILGVGEREVPGQRADGSIIALELSVSEVVSGDDHLFAGILRDISERKAAQQALMDSYLALEHKQKELDRDLEAAANIQLSLLPHSLPDLQGLDVGWFFQPSIKIGGDIFNLVPLSHDHLGIYILDVSGHGVPAALVAVSVAQVLQREGCLLQGDWMEPNCELTSPSKVLELLDAEFPLERFGTFFTISYLVLNIRTGELQFSNAGHPCPLLIRSSGQVHSLETEGTVIGLGGMLPFTTGSITLQPEDTLILYTDGVYEQTDASGAQWGWETLRDVLVNERHRSAQGIADSVHSALNRFTKHGSFDDDLSLACVQYTFRE